MRGSNFLDTYRISGSQNIPDHYGSLSNQSGNNGIAYLYRSAALSASETIFFKNVNFDDKYKILHPQAETEQVPDNTCKWRISYL